MEAAVLEILRLLNFYGVAVDCRCWEAFDDIFAQGVVADYAGVEYSGRETFKSSVSQAWGNFD